jgi:hypothetical protein
VLKKAGIVVGIVASGMLALTPLASAEVAAPAQVTNTCSFTQSGPVIVQTVNGITLLPAIAAPITIGTQAGNCIGFSSTTVTNTNSGNTTVNSVRTHISNSFNRSFFH